MNHAKLHRVDVGGDQTRCARMLLDPVTEPGMFERVTKVFGGTQVLRVTTMEDFTCEACRRRGRTVRDVRFTELPDEDRTAGAHCPEHMSLEEWADELLEHPLPQARAGARPAAVSGPSEDLPGCTITTVKGGQRIEIRGKLRYSVEHSVSVELPDTSHVISLEEVFSLFEDGVDDLADGQEVRLVIEPVTGAERNDLEDEGS